MTNTTLTLETEYYDAVETFVDVANDHPRTAGKIGNERAVIQWWVDGDTFHMTFNDGAVSARAGEHPQPRVTAETDAETLIELVRGERDITNFVGEGEIHVVAGRDHFLDLIVMGRVLSACASELQEEL